MIKNILGLKVGDIISKDYDEDGTIIAEIEELTLNKAIDDGTYDTYLWAKIKIIQAPKALRDKDIILVGRLSDRVIDSVKIIRNDDDMFVEML